MLRGWILVAALAAPWTANAADPSGTITILEGEALVYRGTGRVAAVEGLRLQVGDIVETGASTFAQVELPDQSVAQFGPASRVMFNAATTKGKAEFVNYSFDVKVEGGRLKVSLPGAG